MMAEFRQQCCGFLKHLPLTLISAAPLRKLQAESKACRTYGIFQEYQRTILRQNDLQSSLRVVRGLAFRKLLFLFLPARLHIRLLYLIIYIICLCSINSANLIFSYIPQALSMSFMASALVFSAMSMYGRIALQSEWPVHFITTCGGTPLDRAKQMNVLLTCRGRC